MRSLIAMIASSLVVTSCLALFCVSNIGVSLTCDVPASTASNKLCYVENSPYRSVDIGCTWQQQSHLCDHSCHSRALQVAINSTFSQFIFVIIKTYSSFITRLYLRQCSVSPPCPLLSVLLTSFIRVLLMCLSLIDSLYCTWQHWALTGTHNICDQRNVFTYSPHRH